MRWVVKKRFIELPFRMSLSIAELARPAQGLSLPGSRLVSLAWELGRMIESGLRECQGFFVLESRSFG